MPFDNPKPDVEIANREEIAILDGMARRLATPKRWCKGVLERGEARCIIGALNEENHGMPCFKWGDGLDAVVKPAALRVVSRLADFVPAYGQSTFNRVVFFNNAPTTTHADILALIRKARASFE